MAEPYHKRIKKDTIRQTKILDVKEQDISLPTVLDALHIWPM